MELRAHKQLREVKAVVWSACVMVGVLGSLTDGIAGVAQATGQKKIVIDATTATGWNRYFGKPIGDIPGRVEGHGFATIGKYNQGSEMPIPLKEDMSEGTVISNFFDPNFAVEFSVPAESIDMALDNVPLRDFPVNNDASGINRTPVRGILEAGQTELSQAEPAGTVTLGSWMKARGRLEVTCEADGEARARIIATNLLPNRYYQVLESFQAKEGNRVVVLDGMLGGVPDVVATDENGNALFETELNHCLPESLDEVSPSLNVTLVYRTSHRSFGATAATFRDPLQPRYLGEDASVHLYFPTTGERLVPAQEGAPTCDDVFLPDAQLTVAPPIGPATGPANFVIGGKPNPATATVTFFAPPRPMADGRLSFFAQIFYDFGGGNVLHAKVDGDLTPMDRPGVFINHGNITYHGGTGIYEKAFGHFQAGGILSFADLHVSMHGTGLVCNRGVSSRSGHGHHRQGPEDVQAGDQNLEDEARRTDRVVENTPADGVVPRV